jgi:hypothetical protein
MVHPYRSVNCCLSAAAHYEQQGKRAADPTAQQKFLDVAARWRQLAHNDQFREQEATSPSSGNVDPKQLPPKSLALLASLADLSQLFGQLGVGRTVNVDTFAKLLRQTSRAAGRLLLHVNEVGRRRKHR